MLMNENTLPFTLTYSEALEMDNLFISNKSFKKQIDVLISLNLKLFDKRELDKIVYYVNTLIEELYDVDDIETIIKYLQAIQKQNLLNIALIFLKVIFCIRHKISYYITFQKDICNKCIKESIDYELELKDFLDTT